jgi:hypothetical protein
LEIRDTAQRGNAATKTGLTLFFLGASSGNGPVLVAALKRDGKRGLRVVETL